MSNQIIEDKVREYMKEFINKPMPELSDEEKDFEKYCKLYEERFGKRAYIAEPSGTRKQTINAIKICLEKNEDLLDKLLYPNLEENMNNGFLYSEQNIANKDEIDWQEGKSSEVTNNSILGYGFDSILNIDNIIEENDKKIAEIEQETLDGKSEEEQQRIKEKCENQNKELKEIENGFISLIDSFKS